MEDQLIIELEELLEQGTLLKGEELNNRYSHIWKMDEGLKAKAVVMPRSTEELSGIMKICSTYEQSIVVHGGLTNLVGSTETTATDLVISTEKLNKVEELDLKSRTITVGAGVILENIQNLALENDMLFPLNFGAKGSAQIGGVISTNAGGLRVLKFGMTRNLVLGLEAVLADGTIISSMKKIIKDNSAYDIKQLFIGSEGTLGIITKAVLKLIEAPKSRVSAFVAFNDYEQVITFLKYIDRGLSGSLSGFELIWNRTYKCMTSPTAQSKPPLPDSYNYYVLLEALGSNYESDLQSLEYLLEAAIEEGMILDATLAQSDSDMEWFWKIREDVHVLASQGDFDQHFDVSLPIPSIGSYVDDIIQKLLKENDITHVFPFGHVADGNIHFIIGKANNNQSLTERINEVIYRPLQSLGGSVSAEHGIGLHKKNYLHLCRSKEEIRLMEQIKNSMDPKNLLNRSKVLF